MVSQASHQDIQASNRTGLPEDRKQSKRERKDSLIATLSKYGGSLTSRLCHADNDGRVALQEVCE